MDEFQAAIMESLVLAEPCRVPWEKLDQALSSEGLRGKQVPGPWNTLSKNLLCTSFTACSVAFHFFTASKCNGAGNKSNSTGSKCNATLQAVNEVPSQE